MAGAILRVPADRAVDERDVVVEHVVGHCVLELRVVAAEELLCAADFDADAALRRAADGFRVAAAGVDFDGSAAALGGC